MSLPRRLSPARTGPYAAGAVVIEDDYDSDFRFSGRPLETLHSLDNGGRVVYVASFSKLLMPTLRLGFLIAPPGIQNALTAARAVTDWHTPAPSQQTLAEFIDSGHLARHLRRMRTRYQVRHDLITATIAHDLGRWLTPLPSHAGMHLTARAAAGVNASTMDAIVADARQRGVKVFPLHWYASRPDECAGLVLGYGAIDVAAIHRASPSSAPPSQQPSAERRTDRWSSSGAVAEAGVTGPCDRGCTVRRRVAWRTR